MIPKKIHYCWFGGNEKPAFAKKCIASWKKYCPDYEIIEWNEDNFDVNSNAYVKEAYENKKYAFVTDYVRLYALVNNGGIYMDTDVEVVGSLDEFLSHEAFSGFEEDGWVPTGLMACRKDFPLFKELLEDYNTRKFVNADGSFDTTTNTFVITKSVEKYGLIKNGEYQVINGFALYPKDVFCPLDNATGVVNRTKNTKAIHWFSKSWLPNSVRFRVKITRFLRKTIGNEFLILIKKMFNK